MKLVRTLSWGCVFLSIAALGLAFPTACTTRAPDVAAREPSTTRGLGYRSPKQDQRATEVKVPGAGSPDEGPRGKPKPQRFAVASENATATELAMSVLRQGGSAVDAAIVGVLTVGVTHPVSSGLGGGGFAMIWDNKSKKVYVLDFRETAPRGIALVDFLKRPPTEARRAAMTGVPGEVRGLYELSKRWGKVPIAQLFARAAEVSDSGFSVSPHMARSLKWNETWIQKASQYSFFRPLGALAAAGTIVRNNALATTLRRIGAEGEQAFYSGAIATEILRTARSAGSKMTASDLRDYKVEERTPLKVEWEGHTVYTMPPPSAGGLMLAETIKMFSPGELSALGFNTGAYLHTLAETFRGAIADRIRNIGDPGFVKPNVVDLIAPERLRERKMAIKPNETTIPGKYAFREAGTSHLVAIDHEGNMVSITSTINNMFGAKLITGAGFPLNDELDDFASEATESRYGVFRGPNFARPGARPVSSMTPTIVVRGEAPIFALGGSGGSRIATAVTQVFLNHLVFGRDVAAAVEDPRIDTPALGGILLDSIFPAGVAEDLQLRGEAVEMGKPNYSAVQAISIETDNGVRRIEAAADPRKFGSAQVD